uniref:Uncharacterized protein n=2 Tax=Cacopsylla melanoneura TaxID=428564 RepID=A0A8D9BLN7_9HEMI
MTNDNTLETNTYVTAMKLLVFSLKFITWSSTLTLLTCLPLHTQTGPEYTQNRTTIDLADNLGIEQQNGTNNIKGIEQQDSAPYASELSNGTSDSSDTLGRTDQFLESNHHPLNRGEQIHYEVVDDNEDENIGSHQQQQSRILDGLDKILGSRLKRQIKLPKSLNFGNRDIVERFNGDNYIREETSILLVIVAILLILLCIYYCCSCCIFFYYLKSQFCFDIDLYKKPEATCAPKCEQRYTPPC